MAIENQVIRLAELPGDEPRISDMEFEKCHFQGPAVIVPTGCEFSFNTFDAPSEDALLWEVPPSRTEVVGAILVERCRFTNCRFMGIGIAGPPDTIAQFRTMQST
jgi:hypothetical protein